MKEFIDRPTLRLWKNHLSALRHEQRLARAPFYRLMTLFLLILGCVALISLVLILDAHSVLSNGR